MPAQRHPGPDLSFLLFRHAPRITLAVCLPLLAALLYNAATGPAYTASVRVLVTQAASSGLEATASAGAGHGQTARNQAALLNDRGLMAKFFPPVQAEAAPPPRSLLFRAMHDAGGIIRAALARLGLLTSATGAEILADRMGASLRANALGDTDVVLLRFTWNDRPTASRTLDRVLAGYQQAVATASQARGFLAQARSELAQAQSDLGALDAPGGARDGGSADAAREKAAIEARLAAARQSADALRLERELAKSRLETVEQEYRGGGWVDGASQPGGTVDLAADFAALLKQRQVLAADGRAAPRALRRLDAEIAEVRDQNYQAVRRRARAALDELSDRLLAAEAGIAREEASLRQWESQAASAAVLADARAARMARVAAARQTVALAATRIDPVWQEVGVIRALSQAVTQAAPDFPSPAFRLDAAAWLGAALGLATALLAERRRITIDRPADIGRHLRLEVLARLAEIPVAKLP